MSLIGHRFGNYQAVSLLGEGGMGAVYLAEHPDIGRKVAIKVLRQEYSRDPQLLQRFLNEARAANAIRHPNIIEILDSGTTADGMPYLVMELLEGEPLSGRIKRVGHLSVKDALELAYETASALGAAHRKGIVHRDLKPDNLFVVPDEMDPSREHVKVLDFGIAKLQMNGPGESVKTRTGTLMGTPVYMSPEQCLGTRDVDHRSDIYSLGLIVFEMLCGRPPFFSEGFGELVNMHLNVPAPLLRSVIPEMPQSVEEIVQKALAKKPEDRFSSMADLQAALRACAGPTLVLRSPSSPDLAREAGRRGPHATAPLPSPGRGVPAQGTLAPRAEETTRPHPPRRRLAAIAIGGMLALGGGALVFGLAGRRAPDAPSPAPPPPVATPAAPQPRPTQPPPKVEARRVRLRIDSDPPGARVVSEDGAVLGETPLSHETAPADTPLAVLVQKDGYLPARLALPRDRDSAESVRLSRRPGPKPSKKPRPPVVEEPAKL